LDENCYEINLGVFVFLFHNWNEHPFIPLVNIFWIFGQAPCLTFHSISPLEVALEFAPNCHSKTRAAA
jgi:hypothetical protein